MWNALYQAYLNSPNYKIIENPQAEDPNLAVIYFSSLGTFNSENWQQRLQTDYYEFHRNPVKRAGRHIYVRDVALDFYQMGINPQTNSVEKLLPLLKQLTAGKKVITVGVSSGGYMAVLAGAYLKAQYVISISGFIDITSQRDWISKGGCPWSNPWVDKYLDIREFVEASNVPVFQFESCRCEIDLPNAEKMRRLKNVRMFNIDSVKHGGQLAPLCIAPLLNLSYEKLTDLWQKYDGKVISQWNINRSLLPLKHLLLVYVYQIKKKMFKFKFKKDKKQIVVFGITLLNRTQ